jgi:hypothetical protein
MKINWFHLMPYPYLPDDFKQKYRSVWVDVPSHLYDPEKGHTVYNDRSIWGSGSVRTKNGGKAVVRLPTEWSQPTT